MPAQEERDIGAAEQQRRGGRALAAALAAFAWLAVLTAVPTAEAAGNVAFGWGFNEDGELGDGTTEDRAMPIELAGLGSVSAVAAGDHHSLALLPDGSVMAWGENAHGQLGDGGTAGSRSPVPVRGLTEAAMVAAGGRHSLALLRNGDVVAWGDNESGQLGDGTTESSDVPVAVSNLSGVASIAAGGSFSLALLRNGSVRAWGENFFGQLGNRTAQGSDVPVAVSGLEGATAITAGFRHSLALLSGGTVMAWGNNRAGQLGDGSTTGSDVPVAVGSLSGVTAVSAGVGQSLAVVGGAVMAWGSNERGQLGVGNDIGPELCGALAVFACSRVPVSVGGLAGAATVSAGSHSLALLHDGAVMAWGPNNAGQLGIGSVSGPEVCGVPATPCSTVPVVSHTPDAAVRISAGGEFSLSVDPSPRQRLPELGRCVAVAGGGAYGGTTPRCVALSHTHDGHFEWLAGPGARSKLEGTLSEPKFETVGKNRLSCVSGRLEGEYTGPKTAAIDHLRLTGCRASFPSASCQSGVAQEGAIESSVPLEGELGFIVAGERPRVGWAIRPQAPGSYVASFGCGAGTTTTVMTLEGSVIGRVTPIDQMVATFELRYAQSSGKQIPEALEGGVREVLTLVTAPLVGAATTEQVGINSKAALTGEEALEIKAKA